MSPLSSPEAAEDFAPGWRRVRREVSFRDLPFSQVMNFVEAGLNQRPPWRLVKVTVHGSARAGCGQAALTLEAVERAATEFGILCDDDHSVVRAYNMGQCSDTPSHVCFEVVHDVQFPTMLIVDTSGVIRYRRAVDASGAPDRLTLLEECRKARK